MTITDIKQQLGAISLSFQPQVNADKVLTGYKECWLSDRVKVTISDADHAAIRADLEKSDLGLSAGKIVQPKDESKPTYTKYHIFECPDCL